MSIIRVNLGAKSYNIEIAAGLLDTAGEKSAASARRSVLPLSATAMLMRFTENVCRRRLQAAALK